MLTYDLNNMYMNVVVVVGDLLGSSLKLRRCSLIL